MPTYRLIRTFINIILGSRTFFCVHKHVACHILNVIPDVSVESLMCSTLLPYFDDGISKYNLLYLLYFTIAIDLSLPVIFLTLYCCRHIRASCRMAMLSLALFKF